jgi:hypothetical protein
VPRSTRSPRAGVRTVVHEGRAVHRHPEAADRERAWGTPRPRHSAAEQLCRQGFSTLAPVRRPNSRSRWGYLRRPTIKGGTPSCLLCLVDGALDGVDRLTCCSSTRLPYPPADGLPTRLGSLWTRWRGLPAVDGVHRLSTASSPSRDRSSTQGRPSQRGDLVQSRLFVPAARRPRSRVSSRQDVSAAESNQSRRKDQLISHA